MNDMNNSVDPGPRWKEKFALLEKIAGGTDVQPMSMGLVQKIAPGGQKLTFKENYQVICWPAFFFGPFWYFYKGMWKKALVLIGVWLALATLIGILFGARGGSGAVYASYGFLVGRMATIDYYRQLKQGFNDWW